MKTRLRAFITDCEGPISKNDNAFELMSRVVPRGDYVFTLISRYDDFLADVVKKPGYKAGDTLKLILPFLKAYGATNALLRKYSAQNILLVPMADETLRVINGFMPSFIVSTSYEHYITALCDIIGFPKTNVYCTRLDIDKYGVPEGELARLRAICQEISLMPMIEIPGEAKSVNDLSEDSRRTIKRLDEIFWKEISYMQAGAMIKEVNPVGGFEKANSVIDITKKLGVPLSDVIYVGDSITDVDPFRLIRAAGGLTVSFNGNRYAVREAEIAVMSHHTDITTVLAFVFNQFGKEKVLSLVEERSWETLKSTCDSALFQRIMKSFSGRLPRVERITSENVERLTAESSAFRKTVRGEAVARLG